MNPKSLITLALFATLPLAYAATVPVLKEGLWKVHVVQTDGPGTKPDVGDYQLCRNHAYDQSAEQLAASIKGCTITGDTTLGTQHTMSAVCKVANITITTKTVSTVTDSRFHSESATTYSPAFAGKTQSTEVTDETWAGACPANLKPGDRLTSGGEIVHTWHD